RRRRTRRRRLSRGPRGRRTGPAGHGGVAAGVGQGAGVRRGRGGGPRTRPGALAPGDAGPVRRRHPRDPGTHPGPARRLRPATLGYTGPSRRQRTGAHRMTHTRSRVLAASALVAVAAAGGCGTRAEAPVDSVSAVAEPRPVTSAQTGARDRPDPRTDDEQEFLAELSGFGLPTEMTAVTTIEVGAGICGGIADGADDETILERI